MDTITKAYRQGDVSILTAARLPKGAKKIHGEPVLARGEVTGHAHRIVEGQVLLYQLGALLYLRVLSEFAKLYHEEHEDVILSQGDYEIRRQREWNWARGREVRYVED